jgi:hypothetical protein
VGNHCSYFKGSKEMNDQQTEQEIQSKGLIARADIEAAKPNT